MLLLHSLSDCPSVHASPPTPAAGGQVLSCAWFVSERAGLHRGQPRPCWLLSKRGGGGPLGTICADLRSAEEFCSGVQNSPWKASPL